MATIETNLDDASDAHHVLVGRVGEIGFDCGHQSTALRGKRVDKL
jgi:hypothetical protein